MIVAIPARDEQRRIVPALRGVLTAIRSAREDGQLGAAVVAVAAHCCSDETAQAARAELDAARDVRRLVWETSERGPVGRVRFGLVRQARLLLPSINPQRTWLFSTDADSRVPAQWITAGLAMADAARARAVVGLVDLDDQGLDPLVRAAHDRLVGSGLRTDGSHDHVYAANLAVRLDTYLHVGGFPAVGTGEEHGLVAAVRAAGHPVLTTQGWRVHTSSRTRGRARGGLGDLLGELAARIP